MNKHKKHFQKPVVPGSPENTKNEYAGQRFFAQWLGKIEALKTLPFLAGLSQFLLGMAVVVIAVLGFIRSFWVPVILGAAWGVAAITGIYFCYLAIIEHSNDTLVRDALRRITEDQN